MTLANALAIPRPHGCCTLFGDAGQDVPVTVGGKQRGNFAEARVFGLKGVVADARAHEAKKSAQPFKTFAAFVNGEVAVFRGRQVAQDAVDLFGGDAGEGRPDLFSQLETIGH